MADIDYLVCKNCESPCYVFELDAKEKVANAFCQTCGNDEAAQFRNPEGDDDDVDDEDLGPHTPGGGGGGAPG
jgi:hypothetical protein